MINIRLALTVALSLPVGLTLVSCNDVANQSVVPGYQAEITPAVQKAVDTANTGDSIPVIIRFQKDPAELASQVELSSTTESGYKTQTIISLQASTQASKQEIRSWLESVLGDEAYHNIKDLWIINAIAVDLPVEFVEELSYKLDVKQIAMDEVVPPVGGSETLTSAPESNLQLVGADALWNLGYSGTGVVVGHMDSGVDILHPDLSSGFRGGSNSWYDPYVENQAPSDKTGHGTGSLGIILGGDSDGTYIGMAPGAQWISAKIFNNLGEATYSAIHQSFQWMIDPDGNPETDDAPNVVNNSWSLPNSSGTCETEFQADISLLNSLDIGVIFSAGNNGPSANTNAGPANNAGTVSVGSLDRSNNVSFSSSRGPSACDNGIFPDLVAPGQAIKTADLTSNGAILNAYAYRSGTSFAVSHVTGGYALLKSAFPKANHDQIEMAMRNTAVDLDASGADNNVGYGLLSLLDAYQQLSTAPVANDDSAVTVLRAPVTINLLQNDTIAGDTIDPSSVVILSDTPHSIITNNGDGTITFQSLTFVPGIRSYSYRVSNSIGISSNTGRVQINVTRR